jgi:hypothetical protein
MGIAGGPAQGYGWFTYDTPAPICLSGCRHVGLLVASFNTQRIGRGVLDGLESRLGVTLATDTAHEVLAEVLTRNGDPTGVTAYKPLLSQSIHLGGRAVWKAPKNWYEAGADPVWRDLALRVKQSDYALMKVEMTARGSDQYLRVADKWVEDYGFDVRTAEQQKDGLLPHETTIGDTFVEAVNTDLASHTATGPNGGFSWTYLGGTSDIEVIATTDDIHGPTSGNTRARAEADLSTVDHYSQFVGVAWPTTITNNMGPMVRVASAADSFYALLLRDRADAQYRLFKFTTGTPSQVGTSVDEALPAEPATAKLEVTGSTLTGYMDDVSKISGTDSSFTTQLRTGLMLDRGTADNFEAADLEEPPAGGDRTRVWYGSVQ